MHNSSMSYDHAVIKVLAVEQSSLHPNEKKEKNNNNNNNNNKLKRVKLGVTQNIGA